MSPMFEADDGDKEKEHVMMKTVRIFAVLAVFTMALTGLSLAQQPNCRLALDIPFDFNVGNQHFAAGPYVFAVDYGDPVVTVRNTATGQTAMAFSVRVDDERAGNPAAVFDVVGGQHTLADLKAPGHAVGFAEPKTAVGMAKNKDTITIVASLR
ncbi:MAG: hypothetical protein WAN69_08045 [Candidatus Korobacteraceae bacterium]|jgi:hypothetical protein